MTVSYTAALALGLCLIINILAVVPVRAHDRDICYAVADSGDTLVTINKDGTNFAVVGNTGTTVIEAIAMRSGIPHLLYAANAGEFGTINLTTGNFTIISASIGTGNGTDGNVTFSDIDSLAFDPRTDILWGAHRRSGQQDVLIQIDPATGTFIPNVFQGSACGSTSPCDYIVIQSNVVPVNHPDIDDIAIDPLTGTMYAIANSGGGGDDLVTINSVDGTITNVGPLGVNDMEGFSNLNDGILYGTTGSAGTSPNRLWTININTGNATEIATFGSGSDYESVSCLTESGNVINGTVFIDDNTDGMFDPPSEGGLSGVTVKLYIDENNDDLVDDNDTLLTTATTDINGNYQFPIGIQDNFVLEVDTNTVPNGVTLTTDNVEEADFASYGNTDNNNNFGLTNLPTLSIIKTSNTPNQLVAAGDTITYTMQIQNLSATTQTGVTVSDPLPSNTTYVAQSTVATLPTLTTVASDDFESQTYSGGSGWSGNWTEVNESNGAGSNDVTVQTNSGGWRLKVQDSDKGVYRRVDLSSATSATLSFDLRRRNLDAGESLGVYASGPVRLVTPTLRPWAGY